MAANRLGDVLGGLMTLFGAVPAGAAAPPVPVEAFFAPAPLQDATLSPDGRWLATVVQPQGARAQLVVTDLNDQEPSRIVARFSSADVHHAWWVDDEWLVFDTRDEVDRSDNWRRWGGGLVAVRRDGERMRVVINRDVKSLFAPVGTIQPLEPFHEFLQLGTLGSTEVIVARRQFDAGHDFKNRVPFAVDIVTGRRRSLVASAPDDASQWWFDAAMRPRAAAGTREGKARIYWLDDPGSEWRTLATFDSLREGWAPAFIDEAGNLFGATLSGAGFSSIAQVHLGSGRLATEPLITTPGFSSGIRMVVDPRDGRLAALDVTTERTTRVWIDPRMKALQARIDATLPGRVNRLLCRPCDAGRAVLVHSYSDRSPGDYLVYGPREGQWRRFGSVRPTIDPARMAEMHFQRIRARDGHELPVWITATATAGDSLRPAVVLVHGGPWVRGFRWGWSDEAQFLASRGYVVIQPEFRGSAGYGHAHFRAGWKQWGQAMQDDLSDALRFAIERHGVDPKRVCIAGASYGGYAVLMGLAKDPGQFRCGVAWAGVSDPRLMYSIHWSDITPESREYGYPRLIGDPVADAAMLEQNAPLARASAIKARVFLAYGRRDQRVPIEHGERMRDALVKAGSPPQWLVYDDEGHGWLNPANRIDFWTRVETFLAESLE